MPLAIIRVTPANSSIALENTEGGTEQLTAMGTNAFGETSDITSQVIWTSSNPAVATINSAGLATAVSGGTTTITATAGNISGNTTLTVTSSSITLVSISVTPANPSVQAGSAQQFTAVGTYSDGTSLDITSQVSWTSSATTVATISSGGIATAVSTGTTTITAARGNIFGNTTLSVSGSGSGSDSWRTVSTVNSPTVRQEEAKVWTGSEMIIWGGENDSQTNINTGGRYKLSTDSWSSTSTVNAPAARRFHTGVWTGAEMIVWGGYDITQTTTTTFNTGGRYNPVSDTWLTVATNNAPSGRILHSAVWTGSRMLIWGGFAGSSGETNTGGQYNPATDTWQPMSTVNAPTPRDTPGVIWTGTELIVWGGENSPAGGNGSTLNTGARYNPSTDTWAPMSTINAPTPRVRFSAVWTGTEMIVWGGDSGVNALGDGARYNPATDTWTPISAVGAPSPRSYNAAVWTGTRMIIWGGDNGLITGNGIGVLGDGDRYNPATNTWTQISAIGAPSPRSVSAVWTGQSMLIWGGFTANNTLGRDGGVYIP